MPIEFVAMETDLVHAYRAGEPDANGHPAERAVSDGIGKPCRHCLRDVPAGDEMLILAHRPFDDLHPYAEVGPIFLCAADCARHEPGADLPPVIADTPKFLIKGYSKRERIVYGTGAVVPATEIADRCAWIFADPDVAQIHIRSARNNCYQARVLRSD